MEQSSPATLFETRIRSLKKIHQGKVRDIYDVDAEHLLIVATDRLSAFDVVLPDPIPFKGQVLTQISLFWFGKTAHMVQNHLSTLRIEDIIADPQERAQLAGRSMVVKKLTALPLEAVVRGYLIGSGYKDYSLQGSVCGIRLPPGLKMAQQLPEPIFTPASKAPAGAHDENIDFDEVVRLVGQEMAASIRRISLEIYQYAAQHARARHILIADTKFEFGIDAHNNLVLADEVFTPDSSRYWPAADYRVGHVQTSFDKQFVRNWLIGPESGWDRGGSQPPPALPDSIINATRARYVDAYERISGLRFADWIGA
jgi:phosphoribosylaminoimidazole-succinocarboxamide synthase